jgi:hypothetical protein
MPTHEARDSAPSASLVDRRHIAATPGVTLTSVYTQLLVKPERATGIEPA